jgi:hypothetical protein
MTESYTPSGSSPKLLFLLATQKSNWSEKLKHLTKVLHE